MPCVVFKAEDVGATGYEDRETLDADDRSARRRIEAIRLKAGPLMNLGDVTEKSVPKMMLVAPPQHGGAVTVRSFIPHRAHATIGVLGAVSVATACLVEGSPAAEVAAIPEGQPQDPVGRASDRRDELRARTGRGRAGRRARRCCAPPAS